MTTPSDPSPAGRKSVIIVGAGFSGLIAARELEAAGVDVRIHEARDRIGGRAWTDERLGGHSLEMGATWVHWMQPFVWTEITRYAQEIYPSPDIDDAYWVSEGVVHRGTEHDLDTRLSRLQDTIFEGSREFFPYRTTRCSSSTPPTPIPNCGNDSWPPTRAACSTACTPASSPARRSTWPTRTGRPGTRDRPQPPHRSWPNIGRR